MFERLAAGKLAGFSKQLQFVGELPHSAPEPRGLFQCAPAVAGIGPVVLGALGPDADHQPGGALGGGIGACGRVRRLEHRLDHRRVVQLAEQLLQRLQPPHEGFDFLLPVERAQELGGITEALHRLAQLVAVLDAQAHDPARAFSDAAPGPAERGIGDGTEAGVRIGGPVGGLDEGRQVQQEALGA